VQRANSKQQRATNKKTVFRLSAFGSFHLVEKEDSLMMKKYHKEQTAKSKQQIEDSLNIKIKYKLSEIKNK